MNASLKSKLNPVPVYQPLDNWHLSLFELFLGITASSVRKVDGMADLNIISERNILYFDTVCVGFPAVSTPIVISEAPTHSCVSHFPNSLTS